MPLRVLIAEDEALVAMSLQDLLDSDGHDVETAPNGAAALSAARSLGGLLDVLVTDLNMPFLSGEDLIHDLRTERPDLPVVVVSGSPPPGGAAELRAISGGYGPLVLLDKPVDHEALLRAVREVACTATQPTTEWVQMAAE
ncbi:response regulator [Dankookia sp. GCM10030260]|uniref:response regulator n=1 Tax=Dankookia sp. GCM10030260 TaxID=3273390 RepID=UPI003613177D